MQVEGYKSSDLETGARVRNAYAIYLSQRDSPEKFGLIPYSIIEWHHLIIKDLSVKDEHASH
jgi:hypothetical protein